MLNFQVDVLLSYSPVFNGSLEPFLCKKDSLRHLKVKPSVCNSDSGIGRSPVGHQYSLETPLIAEDINVHPGILSRVNPVHRIVTVHHRTDACLLDRLAECREIDFIQSPFIDIGTDGVAGIFLVVGGKMLDCRHHSLILHSEDIVLRHFRSKVRVFTEIFIIPAAQRRTVDVHPRTEHYVNTPCLRVSPQSVPKSLNRITVPRCRRAYTARVQGAFGVVPHTARTVRHPDLRYPQPWDCPDIK